MHHASTLRAILRNDSFRWHILEVVRSLNLPDGWAGAGFVRNAVWDYLHGRAPCRPRGDIDVLWFDAVRTDAVEDLKYEAALRTLEPDVCWSVKNQARMHRRNSDAPYASATDAMRYWPETATAVAVRRTIRDECEIAAPFGLDDLFGLKLRPTPAFATEKRAVFEYRIEEKRWLRDWSRLRVIAA